MELKLAQKIAYCINTLMLSMVWIFTVIFIIMDIKFLIYFSIPTIVIYNITYYLIYKKKLNYYIWTCYFGLVTYTATMATCLGPSYGFHLYCFSMIPCAYTLEYMSFKLGRKGVKAFYISIGITVLYIVLMFRLALAGPIYNTNSFALFFIIVNSASVFGYLVGYVNYLIKSIIKSEKQLMTIAHKDNLTGLFNRHYMLNKMQQIQDDKDNVLAIVDIDDFKKINDTYGHNAGDEVLRKLSERMKDICDTCDIARWGGEEFLILYHGELNDALLLLEELRASIESKPVFFEDDIINITATIGVSRRRTSESIDEWVKQIDKLLYTGKRSGKNKVVFA